jgi:hypothetical protein
MTKKPRTDERLKAVLGSNPPPYGVISNNDVQRMLVQTPRAASQGFTVGRP